MATLDQINRTVTCEILSDFRKRVTRRYDIVDGQATMKDGVKFDANVRLSWGTEDDTYSGTRLVKQDVVGQVQNTNRTPNDPPAYLIRVFEEIPRNTRIIVGNPAVSFNQYGFREVVVEYIAFSDASTSYDDIVGTSTAPAPYATSILKNVEGSDDGTLRHWKLTYTTGGVMSDIQTLKFGGKVIVRVITTLIEVPVTPFGFTLVGPGEEYVEGLIQYRYEFAAAAGGGTPGTGGEISVEYSNSQGGIVNFNPASPNTANGITRATIRYVSPLSVTTNPITTPTGFVLVGIEQTDDTGYRMWTGRYERGDGLVVDETTIQTAGALVIYHRVEYDAAPATPSATIGGTVTLFDSGTTQGDGWVRYDYRWAEGSGLVLDESTIQVAGALVTYHRVEFGAAPATPSATIGGTVTLFESSVKSENGYSVYDYRWVEANGQNSITTDGDPDGALNYTVVTTTAAAATPAYPGAGTAYLVRLTQDEQNGYFRNTAVYKKPPATITLNKKISFSKPGNVTISGSPPQLVFVAPVTMDLLTSVEVSYATTQLSDTPFSVSAYATFYETYTPTDTGLQVSSTKSLGGYLAGASGTSGTNSVYNGILCDEWEYQLGASTPSSFGTGAKVLDVDNDPYLVATDGTVVYRRTKVSYTF